MIVDLLRRIQRKWMKLRLQPIRVFCFHHVSEVRDPLQCQVDDWTQLDQFKRNIEKLSSKYTFISLQKACDKLKHDTIRWRHYAVLTTDDGLASVLNITSWLEENRIPLMIFVNTRYMERDSLKPIHKDWLLKLDPKADMQLIAQEMYLSKQQVWKLNSPYIEIGLHGHEHLNVQKISSVAFESEISKCVEVLHLHPRYLAAYAYPWGNATEKSLAYLRKSNIIPVLIDNQRNYKWTSCIHRECIDNKDIDLQR